MNVCAGPAKWMCSVGYGHLCTDEESDSAGRLRADGSASTARLVGDQLGVNAALSNRSAAPAGAPSFARACRGTEKARRARAGQVSNP